ncbi:hypothetical protein HK102_008959 [Quaeritorhiza haematococci]|nr:hypothetical protein HK102_008959 [Quaeritorhiza haematococci]
MWETRVCGASVPHRVWRLPEVLSVIAGYCARSDLVNLGLVCKDWHGIVIPGLWRRVRLNTGTDIDRCTKYRQWIVAVESIFETWLLRLLPLLPNLRELVLHDVERPDALAVLFDLPIRALKLNPDSEWTWDVCWGPSVDRARARSFLHRLTSIDFGLLRMSLNTEMTVLQDAAHEGLRKVNFGLYLLSETGIDRWMKYSHWIVTVESPFKTWLLRLLPLLPNLRELVLHDVENLDEALAALFDLNIRVLKLNRHDDVGWWGFYWSPSEDRVRARTFLHRLVSIDFGDNPLELSDDGNMDPTIIQDAIHEGLQKISFGTSFDLTIDLLSAPHHLTVLCAPYPRNPESFFRIIADHCPHLRALSCPDLVMDSDPQWAATLVENFRYFMRRRGAQLVALEFSMAQGGIEELIEATMQECHSLEYFAPEDMLCRFHPELLNSFLSQCGRRLKYLTLTMAVALGAEEWIEDFFGTQLPILCPNMRIGRFLVWTGGRDRRVLYYGAGRWEWGEGSEKIIPHGYFDHTRYLE